MLLFDELNEDTFLLYAARSYYNPTCFDAEEFYEDVNRFKYLKRLVKRYEDGGKLSVNLILNHLVVIFNVFGIDTGLRMLEYKVFTEENLPILKPFLIYLNVIPNDKYTGTAMDETVVEELRNI